MSAERSMVFHFPGPVSDSPEVGSAVHVTHMLRAFRQLGYDVEVVAGTSRERRAAIKRIDRMIKGGRRFEIAYAKASTAPTALTDPHHVPVRPLLDARFFRRMRRSGTRIGLFYPDVHWRFEHSSQPTRFRRFVFEVFYRFDLAWYKRTLHRFYLPSLPMRQWIPGWEHEPRARGLAPGGSTRDLPWQPDPDRLRLLYVGGTLAPHYDISALLDAVQQVDGVHLTLCCPAGERTALGPAAESDRITVVHAFGEQLDPLYAECDIAMLVYEPIEYRTFAMPVKLFEAIGAGRPVIATADTAVGTFVAAEGVGWSIDNDDVVATLRRLVAHPEEVRERRAAVLAKQAEHTWVSRAAGVSEELLSL